MVQRYVKDFYYKKEICRIDILIAGLNFSLKGPRNRELNAKNQDCSKQNKDIEAKFCQIQRINIKIVRTTVTSLHFPL